MNDKKLLKKAIGMGIIAVLFLLVALALMPAGKKEGITLIIDFGNGERKVLYNDSIAEAKAWGLLQQAAVFSSLDLVAGKEFNPVKIDGHSIAGSDKEWNLYVDGVKQETSPLDVSVKAPSEVIFKLE